MLYSFVRYIKEALIKSYVFSANQLFECCKNVNLAVIAVHEIGMHNQTDLNKKHHLYSGIGLFWYLVK